MDERAARVESSVHATEQRLRTLVDSAKSQVESARSSVTRLSQWAKLGGVDAGTAVDASSDDVDSLSPREAVEALENEVAAENAPHNKPIDTACPRSQKRAIGLERVLRGHVAEIRNLAGRLVALGESAGRSSLEAVRSRAGTLREAGHGLWAAALASTGVEEALVRANQAAQALRVATESATGAAKRLPATAVTYAKEGIELSKAMVRTHPALASLAQTAYTNAKTVNDFVARQPVLGGAYTFVATRITDTVASVLENSEEARQKGREEEGASHEEAEEENLEDHDESEVIPAAANVQAASQSQTQDLTQPQPQPQPSTQPVVTTPSSAFLGRGKNAKKKGRVQIVDSPGDANDNSLLDLSIGDLE